MANHPSALKRQRQAEKKRLRYRAKNREIDELVKKRFRRGHRSHFPEPVNPLTHAPINA